MFHLSIIFLLVSSDTDDYFSGNLLAVGLGQHTVPVAAEKQVLCWNTMFLNPVTLCQLIVNPLHIDGT